jgi:hypothetical protein
MIAWDDVPPEEVGEPYLRQLGFVETLNRRVITVSGSHLRVSVQRERLDRSGVNQVGGNAHHGRLASGVHLLHVRDEMNMNESRRSRRCLRRRAG